MTRHLLTGTSLVAAVMLASGGALAADKKSMKPAISVNGSYEAVVGGILDEEQEGKYAYRLADGEAGSGKVDLNEDTSAVDTRTDAEIHFNGRATLDSGMKVHARVELEGQNNHSAGAGADPIDEYFLAVSGSFGQIILGGTGGAPVKMLTGLSGSWATGVGETLNFDNSWVPSAAGNHYGLQHARLDTGDAEKMTYISPKFGGFQVGLTYSPGGPTAAGDSNARINTADGPHDGIEGAFSYSGAFGDVSFGAGVGMTGYQGAKGKKDDDRSDWLAAARLDFGGGIRVAIAHKRVTNENKMSESQLTDVGVRYVQGANSFSLVGSHGEMEKTDAQHTAVMGSYARALGPGVKLHANVIWNDTQSEKWSGNAADALAETGLSLPAGTYTGQAESSGVALVSGIKVTF